MDKISLSGRYIFPMLFLLYVGLHIGKPGVEAALVPDYIPFPYFWNYFTLVCILLFIVSAVIGKYDKLAYSSLCNLNGFPGSLTKSNGSRIRHNGNACNLEREKELEMVTFFKNIMATGTLFAFAKFVGKGKRIVG